MLTRALAALLLLLAVASAATRAQSRTLTVHAREPGAGTLRALQGVNTGPYTDPGHPDLFASYVTLGFSSVRTHDFFGPTDFGYQDTALGMFPDTSRDPLDPASYGFGPADAVVDEIRRAGEEVFFRLGYSAESPQVHAVPPPPATWATAAGRIVAHFNRGWAGGHAWGIRRWEVWNEPDLAWYGTPQQFFDLYERTARELRRVDPQAEVGGAATSTWNDPAYRDAFLRYCHERGVPLDFFTWHLYTSSPRAYSDAAHGIEGFAAAEGLAGLPHLLTEWNYLVSLPFDNEHCTLRGAAFDLAVLANLATTEIAGAHLYRGDDQFGQFCWPFGLHFSTGVPKTPAYALQAWSRMTEAPRARRTAGGDLGHFTVTAGRSEDGRTLRVALANFDDTTSRRYDLTVDGLGACGVTRTVTRETLGAGGLSVVEQTTNAADTLALLRDGAAPSVTLLTIANAAPWPAHLAAAAAACPAELALAWDAVPGATAYRVFRSAVSCDDALAAAAPVATPAAAAWSDSTAPRGTVLYYAVQPVGAYGACDGDRRCIAAWCPPPAPDPVTELRLARRGGDIVLTWTAAANATSYRVRRATDPDPATWGWPWRRGPVDEDPLPDVVRWTDAGAAALDPPVFFYLVEGEAPAGP